MCMGNYRHAQNVYDQVCSAWGALTFLINFVGTVSMFPQLYVPSLPKPNLNPTLTPTYPDPNLNLTPNYHHPNPHPTPHPNLNLSEGT